jgi:hypothetical protein
MASLCRVFILQKEENARALFAFLKANWRALAGQGKALSVTVTEHKKQRSVVQNKRLHAMLADIAEAAYVNGSQYSQEAWKEYYRRKFIGAEEVRFPDGAMQERGISTTTLSVAEFADFMSRIEAHAIMELGIEF